MLDSSESAVLGGHVDALPGSSSQQQNYKPHQHHLQPKGGKPLWVLNGRVYNYRKEGATPAPNQAAAEETVLLQKAERDALEGLGPGGNKGNSSGKLTFTDMKSCQLYDLLHI